MLLENIFLRSYFIKSFERVIYYPSSTRYHILIENKEKDIYKSIGVMGHYYIEAGDLGFYKNTNSNFETELQNILSPRRKADDNAG